jgi:hypothetical protein
MTMEGGERDGEGEDRDELGNLTPRVGRRGNLNLLD